MVTQTQEKESSLSFPILLKYPALNQCICKENQWYYENTDQKLLCCPSYSPNKHVQSQ